MLATRTGNSNGSGGHGAFCTTRTKKYTVKKEPNSIASEMMKSSTPSMRWSMRELWCASGG